MTEYYFEHDEWVDLRHAVAERDITWIESLIHHCEMRNYRLKMAQAEMIVNHRYFHNPEG